MTLSQPQLKVASVSSTGYGLTKLAELKRHRDGKYRNIIEILGDPLVLLAAYGHLKMQYRTGVLGQLVCLGSGFRDLGVAKQHDGLRGPLESIEREWFDFASKGLLEGNYECKPARRIVVPKQAAAGSRAFASERISVVSPRDQIVQEVVRIVLSYIYNGVANRSLSASSSFGQSSGVHRALRDIRRTWNGVSWFLEFNIRQRDDTISRRILVNILKEEIQDQRFFNLIHKMFNTKTVNLLARSRSEQPSGAQPTGARAPGYPVPTQPPEAWCRTRAALRAAPTGGRRARPREAGPVGARPQSVPQGSILSPLLCDLYLSKLDQEVKRIQVEYNSSQRKRRENPVFKNLTRVTLDEKRQLEFHRYKIRRLLQKRIRRAYQKGISKTDYNDPNFVRIFYVRYADDFLFGVIGSKILVKKVQNRVSQFLKSSLHLEVSKTTIIHSTAGMVNFLGMLVTTLPAPKYCALRRSSESLKRIRLRLKTQSLLRKKAWEASIRRIAFNKWAEAFEKTCKLLGPTTLAKRAAFSNAFELAQRLTTNEELRRGPGAHAGCAASLHTSRSQSGHSPEALRLRGLGAVGTAVAPVVNPAKHLSVANPGVLGISQLLKAEKELFSSTIWDGLPKEIKQKHVELISLLDDHSCQIGLQLNRPKMLSGTKSGCAGSTYWPRLRAPRLLAPLDHIRDQLRRRGIVEDQNFRPTALKRMLNHEDFSIVHYFRAIANGLLCYYRCCDNFHKVKRIATYQIRWAALHTLANKHKLTVKKAIDCYTLDLIIKQAGRRPEKGVIVAKFPSNQEIAIMSRKFLVNTLRAPMPSVPSEGKL